MILLFKSKKIALSKNLLLTFLTEISGIGFYCFFPEKSLKQKSASKSRSNFTFKIGLEFQK